MDGGSWVRDYAEALGVPPPSDEDVDTILRLAAIAAHASERWAAPVSCWLAAQAGWTPADALRLAERMTDGSER